MSPLDDSVLLRPDLRRISVKRSNLSRLALPTQVRNTISSPRLAGIL